MLNMTKFLIVTAVFVLLAGCSLFSPTTIGEGNVEDDNSVRRQFLEGIRTAPTEPAARGRIMEFLSWVLDNPDWIGRINYSLIKTAINGNRNLRVPDSVVDHFFSLKDLFPASCNDQDYTIILKKIQVKRLAAQACERKDLVRALDRRAADLRAYSQRIGDLCRRRY